MGTKTSMLVYAQHNARHALQLQPNLDREATQLLAAKLFPNDRLEPMEDTCLSHTYPPGDEIHVGQFAGVAVVAAKEFSIDCPSRLPQTFIADGPGRLVYLHAMHSGIDWFGYAHWADGQLIRSLSLTPVSGMLEDIGQRQVFEGPFWLGQHPVFETDDKRMQSYPFAFHPLELGEAMLAEFFGYQIEGPLNLPQLVEPDSFPLMRFKRGRSPTWKFWQ